MSVVKTAAARPYLVSLARSTTSSSDLNFMICITGPKICSRERRKSTQNLRPTTPWTPCSLCTNSGSRGKVSKTFRHRQTASAPSYLLPGDGHVVLHVSEHGGLDEVAFVCSRASSTHQLGSLFFSRADVAQDLVELLQVHLEVTT